MGYINLLTQNPEKYGVTDQTKVILDRCAKSVDRERQIINQMLELSVIEAGKIPLEYSVFPVHELLMSLIDAGGYRKQAEITLNVPTDLTFDADKNQDFNGSGHDAFKCSELLNPSPEDQGHVPVFSQ